MTWSPHVTLATIVERHGRFLLVYEHANGKKVYNQPAGHLEPDESLIQAAVRETLEETGWDVEPTHLVNVRLYTAPANGVTYLRTTVVAKPLRHNPLLPLDQDIIETVWLTRDEIAERFDQLRSPMTLRVIDDYLAGQRFPLEIIAPDR
ncbi:NUDIX hydrolase [Marinimicrobium alkaliphilum]|uniref:NUDIX hydrolase n=1 Tax=Marinimicrobium alkaliphilum TaxID=2202654 RepID=UPI000DBA4CF2|nr:NUDIX hydrolase [Marinimicrobium alkaliphilum]